MRPTMPLLLLLGACSANGSGGNRASAPGLDVADVALSNGVPQTTLQIARQMLADDPHNEPALLRQAQAQQALGQRDRAAQSFNQALAIAPTDPAAMLGLARLQLAADPAAAADVLQRLTRQDPRNVAALIDLGIAHDLRGQHIEAQAAYRSALAIDPGRTAATINLGLSLALSGDPQQALTMLRPVAAAPGASQRVRQNLAVALALAGNDDEAVSVLRTDMAQPQAIAFVTDYHALRSPPQTPASIMPAGMADRPAAIVSPPP